MEAYADPLKYYPPDPPNHTDPKVWRQIVASLYQQFGIMIISVTCQQLGIMLSCITCQQFGDHAQFYNI
jgi:hypothetical protein